MKINSISNAQRPSFGALMVQKGEKTVFQECLIDKICFYKMIDDKLIKNLEQCYTDIYISPKKNGCLEMKLLSAAGLTYNFIPRDENGNQIKTTFQPNLVDNPSTIERKLATFVEKAEAFIKNGENVAKNIAMRDMFERISEKEMLQKGKPKLSRPEIIPDAICLLGEPQVTVKN